VQAVGRVFGESVKRQIACRSWKTVSWEIDPSSASETREPKAEIAAAAVLGKGELPEVC